MDIGFDEGYSSVKAISPMKRGHLYMDRFERNSDLDKNYIKYFINIAKTSGELSIGVNGNAKEMKKQYEKVQNEIDDYYTRAKKLTFDEYPELWV